MANIGFIGAGGIARAHAFSLNSLKYYYKDAPSIRFAAVASRRQDSRQTFAQNYTFESAQSVDALADNDELDTIFILGPNNVHYPHFEMVMQMPNVKSVYLEKPVCSTRAEEELLAGAMGKKNVQVGFQFLQSAAVREAYAFWKTGILGDPIHFDLKYYHGDYLKKSYRDKRQTRLTPAPDGGAMADLGSHGISMLMAFLGKDLELVHGMQSGNFADVPADSDLFSTIALVDPVSGAVGQLSASRISSGTGDMVNFELFAENGALRYHSHYPDYFEYYLEEEGNWVRKPVGSHYQPITSFPSGHVPPGWLRSMMHAHYIFLGGVDQKAFVPDLEHGLAVQRVVRETADHIRNFREKSKHHPGG